MPPLLPGNAWDKAHAKHAHTQISAHWLWAAEGNQAADVWQVDVNSGGSSAGLGPSLHAADKLELKTAKLKILWITSAPIHTAGVERNVHGLPENHTHTLTHTKTGCFAFVTFMDAGGHTSSVATGFAKILAEGSNTGFTFQVPIRKHKDFMA